MKKMTLTLAYVSAMLLGFMLFSTPVQAQEVSDLDMMIVAWIDEPITVDPAWPWDTASLGLIQNVYETLIRFAVNRTEPDVRKQGKVDQFVSSLATNWTVSPDGLRYTFKIREGVKFHNGAILTAEDVEYSFERAMVQDRADGPIWALYQPLLNCDHADMNWPSDESNPINQAVQSNSTHFWFNLIRPYAPFLSILAEPWASIVNKQWAIAQGCWDGNWATWNDYHDPPISPLDDPAPVMMGTGPYKFDYWTPGVEWSIVKFDDYWQGWPAPGTEGHVSRATVKNIPDWLTRKKMLLNGSADIVHVPTWNISELIVDPGPPETYIEGVRCIRDLPSLHNIAFFFNFDIPSDSPYLGPGFDPANPYVIAEDRIPVNFFSDIDVRKAFAYSFNFTKLFEDVWFIEAVQPSSPVVEGLPYHNPDNPKYAIDLTKAVEHLTTAWGGQVWNNGFNFTIPYSSRSKPMEMAAYIIKNNVEDLNPKFHIKVMSVSSPTYLEDLTNWPLMHSLIPEFIIGWIADYPDPHNFVEPYMHSQTDFAYWQSYSNATVDALIEEGLTTLDPTTRQEIYYTLQLMYYQDAPSVPLYQRIERHWERDWVKGWYYNPMYSYFGQYFYHLWKENTPVGSNVEVPVPAVGVTVAFDNVLSGGMTGATVSSSGPPQPTGFKLGEPPSYYEITTTATYTDMIEICIAYDETQFADETKLRLLQWDETAQEWQDVTVSLDTENNIIRGRVTRLSLFSVMQQSLGICGAVADEYTKQAIQGVEISILETAATTFTNEQGTYCLADLGPGSYTVEMSVPYGDLTHDTVTKFVEVPPETVVQVNFTLYRASWADATIPRTIGYWKNWDRHYAPEMMATFIEHVKSASGLFSDLTIENVESYFKISPHSAMEEKGRAQLLASWLNVVSAQLGVDVQVDLASISGWETVIADDDGILTVDELLRQIDNFYAIHAAPTKEEWETIKKILDSLNNGKLFT